MVKQTLYINDTVFKHGLFTSNPNPIARHSKYMQWNFTPPEKDNVQIVYTDNSLTLARPNSNNNIAWLIESPEYHKKHYDWIKENYNRFKRIITHDRELLEIDSKFRLAPIGGSWIYNKDFGIHAKTKNFSVICSWKKETSGHLLRHQIVAAAAGHIDVYGSGYNFITDKSTALRDYRFSFAIENCKKDFYFTEKLLDCFLTGTIPIYWGCPSIGLFFNTDGMIIFNTLEDLKNKLKQCTQDFYEYKKDIIKQNYELAHRYLLAEDYIFENNKELLYE